MEVSKEWYELASKYTNDSDLVSQYYSEIEKKYSSSNRFYHNLGHIKSMLLEVKKFQNEINDYDSVLFAIWFHDIIYEPNNTDNEEKSAECSRAFLNNLDYEKNRINKVIDLILRTKDHSNQILNEDLDAQIFLDCDIIIFASERKDYLNYAKSVRNEYSSIPDTIYHKGRINVLESFLNKNYIFRNKSFQKLYEKKARKNVRFEIKMLLK
jgi:predicted metal-dependent HD superfamily phosphohydrolase